MFEHRALFDDSEWRTLQLAPFWVFSAVVGSYRNFDELDYAAFTWTLQSAEGVRDGGLAQDVFESVLLDFDRVQLAYSADDRPIFSGLSEAVRVARKAPSRQAEQYIGALLREVGAGVARARGRFGKIISDEDGQTLMLLEGVLA